MEKVTKASVGMQMVAGVLIAIWLVTILALFFSVILGLPGGGFRHNFIENWERGIFAILLGIVLLAASFSYRLVTHRNLIFRVTLIAICIFIIYLALGGLVDLAGFCPGYFDMMPSGYAPGYEPDTSLTKILQYIFCPFSGQVI